MSRLEKFIEANRDEFDDAEPPAGTWQKVEVALTKKPRIHFLQGRILKWSVAASVLLVIGLAGWLVSNRQKISNLLPLAEIPL